MVEASFGKPYIQVEEEGYIVRQFKETVLDEELVWHRDKKSRTIEVLQGEGWKFQYDNQVPFEIKKGDSFFVEALQYHRLIKGTSDLILKISEKEIK